MKHSPVLELYSPKILLRKSILALCVVPYGYKHAARTACWSMCVSWSCLVRVQNQSKKLILNQAFMYRTTYLTLRSVWSPELFHVHIFVDALLMLFKSDEGWKEQRWGGVHPDRQLMGTCRQTLKGSSPGRRIGLLFTSASIFCLSQSKGKGKVLLAALLLWVSPASPLAPWPAVSRRATQCVWKRKFCASCLCCVW